MKDERKKKKKNGKKRMKRKEKENSRFGPYDNIPAVIVV